MSEIKKYQPSNGTEGCSFMGAFCEQCIHEKFVHTAQDGDKACDIMNRAILFNVKDDEYPNEWRYVNGQPTCVKFVLHDWRDADGNLVEPDEYEEPTEDPNQLNLF